MICTSSSVSPAAARTRAAPAGIHRTRHPPLYWRCCARFSYSGGPLSPPEYDGNAYSIPLVENTKGAGWNHPHSAFAFDGTSIERLGQSVKRVNRILSNFTMRAKSSKETLANAFAGSGFAVLARIRLQLLRGQQIAHCLCLRALLRPGGGTVFLRLLGTSRAHLSMKQEIHHGA